MADVKPTTKRTRQLVLLAVAAVLAVTSILGAVTYRYYSRLKASQSNASQQSNSNSPTSAANSPTENAPFKYDDDQHKLFQAAGITKDKSLIERVLKKLGFVKPDSTVTPDYRQFLEEHFTWTRKNAQFVKSVNTPQKARAYLKTHPIDAK